MSMGLGELCRQEEEHRGDRCSASSFWAEDGTPSGYKVGSQPLPECSAVDNSGCVNTERISAQCWSWPFCAGEVSQCCPSSSACQKNGIRVEEGLKSNGELGFAVSLFMLMVVGPFAFF